MASVEIYKEITDYKKKAIAGLTVKQFVCLVIGLILGTLIYAGGVNILKLNSDLVSYISMFAVIPIFAIGFVNYRGEPINVYLKKVWLYKTDNKKLTYKTELMIDKMQETNKVNNERGKKGVWNKEARKERKAKRANRKLKEYTDPKRSRPNS